MSDPTQPAAPAQPAAAEAGSGKPADAKAPRRAISDPREVASLVMARTSMVNAKKDELAAAINALVDLTQQLTRTYGTQVIAIEHLRLRVKALEEAGARTVPPVPAAQAPDRLQ